MSQPDASERRFRVRSRGAVLTVVASLVTALVVLVPGALAVAGAGFTTTKPDEESHCHNGLGVVNCNLYDGKQYVYVNGGPTHTGSSALTDGYYFFAVLEPGGQPDPNDGGPHNLSDLNSAGGVADPGLCGDSGNTNTGCGDAYTNRIFRVSGGDIDSYGGSHFSCDSNSTGNAGPPPSCGSTVRNQGLLIQLQPFDTTSNPGGVYILALCFLGADANGLATSVSPKDCKYDAFKVSTTSTAPPALDLIPSKDATPSMDRTFAWDLEKKVDATSGPGPFNYTVNVTHDTGTDGDWNVGGDITVYNQNASDVTATLTDQITTDGTNVDPHASCAVYEPGTTTPLPGTWPMGANSPTVFPYACTFTSAGPSALSETNVATLSWDAQTLDNGDLAANPGVPATANIDWTTVDPTLVDNCVDVTDSVDGGAGSPLGTLCLDANGNQLNPTNVPADVSVDSTTNTGKFVITYSRAFSGDLAGTCTSHSNTAAFTLDTSQTTPAADSDDSQTVQHCVGADLQVTKTASPTFKRTYHWGITKDVDKTLVEQIGGTATFTYTVKVTHDNGTDSDWQVTGTITVTNPNDWEAIIAHVGDAVDNGGSCLVEGDASHQVTVPEAVSGVPGSVTLDYKCTYGSAPSPAAGTNTVTVTWDKDAYSTPTGTATNTATFDFGTATATIVDGSVTVTDSFNGGAPTAIGTASYTDPSPKTFPSYPRTVNVPATNCVFRSNTASYTTNTTSTTGTASQTVEVCGPARTGALTMGYWQNKNGQGIINAANQTNLSNWLKNYNPYSDAPSSNLAGYVSGIIKVATCSGPATAPCNKMLRAQMLATALDVYFSDPALGGNKINALAPIGGKSIDLAKICKMIDNLNGTGSCSGTYQDASSAFVPGSYVDGAGTCPAAVLQLNGTKPMTVLCMLANAASNSASGGIPWYGTNKATQVLAKDAFDAINNLVAFSP